MVVNPGDSRAPYLQVADALRREIESGRLAPGDRLQSTREISERFDVTGATAQRAVGVLKTEGLLEGVTGRGVFVRRPRQWRAVSSRYVSVPSAGEQDRWTTEAAKDGRLGTQQITFVGEVEAPDDIGDLLGLSDGEPAVVRKRVMFLDGEPVELTDTYFPASLVRGTRITDMRKIPRGARALMAELGYPPRKALETVYARMPTPDERRELRLGAGVPVFRVVRTVLSDDDLPVEVDVMILGGDRNRLEYDVPVQ